jgi:hypothetical protein
VNIPTNYSLNKVQTNSSLNKLQTNSCWSLRVSRRTVSLLPSSQSDQWQTNFFSVPKQSPGWGGVRRGGRVALCPNRILFVSGRFIVAIVYSLCGSPTAPGNSVSLHGFANRTLSASRLWILASSERQTWT